MVAFFVVNIWLVGMCVPYDDENLINRSGTMGSPFVIAIERANVMWLAHVINGFIFITVISYRVHECIRRQSKSNCPGRHVGYPPNLWPKGFAGSSIRSLGG